MVGALLRAVLVVLLIATPSLLLPGISADLAGLLTRLEAGDFRLVLGCEEHLVGRGQRPRVRS